MARRKDYIVFCEKFKPNIDDDDDDDDWEAGVSIMLYGWSGRKNLKKLNNTPINRIWTLLNCYGKKQHISPGRQVTNDLPTNIDYIITEIPWKEGQRDYSC